MERPHDPSEKHVRIGDYEGPAGGWGSLRGIAQVAGAEQDLPVDQLLRQNKPDGFACVSCAWAKPAEPHPAEFCENGAKATIWDLTRRRATPQFFSEHSVSELLGWSDHELEQAGRLTEPMRYDPVSDRYVPCAWEAAFAAIGAELKTLSPRSVVFYTSGRASLETAYMYGLFARMYGSHNLPDSSNMCHEPTSVGLKQSIGEGVGTVVLDDFREADCLLFFGQNVGSNSPRMLHELQGASERGAAIISFNPLREPGLERFTNPQRPIQMLTGRQTPIACVYHQVKTGGDPAVLTGMCKRLIEMDDEAQRTGAPPVLDHDFIGSHTQGFEAFAQTCRNVRWEDIEHESGLGREAIVETAETYGRARAAIAVYGMGLTQHHHGVQNVQLVCNLLMLRGNIGRPGAGVCPVRGHSNVQGQRTVGITEKPELAPLDRLQEQFGFDPPREKGFNTVEACQALLAGEVSAFIGLGGNFLRAVPDGPRLEAAWRRQRLTVQVATKLNRSHLAVGEVAFLLPCLSRIERDDQGGGPQTVSTEDSTSCIHASFGEREPGSPHLMSEPAIVAGMAKATLEPNPRVDWTGWVFDYRRIREAIAQTYPEMFQDYEARFRQPGGFHKGNKARRRDFSGVEGGKARFVAPRTLAATGFDDAPHLFRLMTLRSNDQFNTTVYGYDDRFRGVKGTREVLFINPADMARLGLQEGQEVGLETVWSDGLERRRSALRVTAYDIPPGCLGAYYPECNVLMPVAHHAVDAMTPAAKSVPVRLTV